MNGRSLLERAGSGSIAQVTDDSASLRAIIDSAGDAIVTANADGEIMTWNLAAERIFGYSEAEVVGEPIRVRSSFVKGYAQLPVRVHPL